MMGSRSGPHLKVAPHLHCHLKHYPTDKIIKLMDRGFAPVAIALSFVAGNGDRSGDGLSIVESFSDTARALLASKPADEPGDHILCNAPSPPRPAAHCARALA